MPDIEEQLRRAIEEGKFSNLAGKGKPLHLEDDPHTDPEWRLAYHLLRENGFSLPWLELRREIEAGLQQARHDLTLAWERVQNRTRIPDSSGSIENEWQHQVEWFNTQVQKLNRRIFDYNLQVPADRFQMRKINPESEINYIQGGGKH